MFDSMAVRRAAVCAGIAAFAPSAFALAPRTFVASYGSDTDPCTLAKPCRGFAAAIVQTSPGGEVVVQDSAGYGTVTITQSVSIIVPRGVYAGISVAGLTPAVVVNAPGGKVRLVGLTINGGTGSQHGIWLQQGDELVVERCVVANTRNGIYATAPGGALTVSDTLVRQTLLGAAVQVMADTRLLLDRSRIIGTMSSGGGGVLSDESASMTIRDSLIALSSGQGVNVRATAGASAAATIDNTVISDNHANGVAATSVVAAGTSVRVSVMRSTITRNTGGYALSVNGNAPAAVAGSAVGNLISQNAFGLHASGTGQFISARDNTFSRQAGGAMGGSGAVHTVRGADGLPSNAGEEATVTIPNVVPVNAF